MDDLVFDDLKKRDGLFYKKFSDVPFTGKVTGEFQGVLKDGERDGPWVQYAKDGTVNKEFTGIYKNDVKIPD